MTKYLISDQIFRHATTMTKTPQWIHVGNPLGRFRHSTSRIVHTAHFSSLRTLRPGGRSSGEAPTLPAKG